jgi:hypothetical protein
MTNQSTQLEKPTSHTIENVLADDEKSRSGPATDYAGATEKTDPIEIALVKKLDMRIMPALWSMYFLNYVGYSPLHCWFSTRRFAANNPLQNSWIVAQSLQLGLMASRKIRA